MNGVLVLSAIYLSLLNIGDNKYKDVDFIVFQYLSSFNFLQEKKTIRNEL